MSEKPKQAANQPWGTLWPTTPELHTDSPARIQAQPTPVAAPEMPNSFGHLDVLASGQNRDQFKGKPPEPTDVMQTDYQGHPDIVKVYPDTNPTNGYAQGKKPFKPEIQP